MNTPETGNKLQNDKTEHLNLFVYLVHYYPHHPKTEIKTFNDYCVACVFCNSVEGNV